MSPREPTDERYPEGARPGLAKCNGSDPAGRLRSEIVMARQLRDLGGPRAAEWSAYARGIENALRVLGHVVFEPEPAGAQ